VKQANGQLEKPGTAVTSVTSSMGLDTQPLKYGNGSVVDANNLTEVQTFQRYVTEKKAAPESKAVLLDYYRQRAQVPATVASQ
jgi:hypothetical protein